MDFRHLIVTCLFSMLRLSFETQKIKENYAIFMFEQDVFIERTRAFKNLTCCFFHNGIYMPKRLTFPSDLSATPQTPCLSAFRLKDMHCEMFQPENILQEKRFPKNRRKISSAETFHPQLKDS